ncbi:MAG: hypothetical protein M3O20_01205 [Acidobacteriota bacterium]|nr:hypothetical protein [Acidobacteriota bacterium]
MAVITLDGGASSAALGGQTITYVQQMVAQQIGGAPDTLIGSHLTRVLNDFYTRSTAFRENVGPYPVNQGQAEVGLNPVNQNLRLQFVLGAYMFPFNGQQQPQPLVPATRMFLGGSPAPPNRFFMRQPDQMILNPVPDKTYGNVLYAYASLVPTTLAAILPDISYTQHVDGLIWGTLARMYQIPKRPWSDKELAQEYQKLYRREIMLARDIANRGFGPADQSFRFPAFAGRSGSQVLPRASG